MKPHLRDSRHRKSIDAELTHSEYMADTANDCERQLAEALIESLDARGSIIMYSSFEKTRIRALIEFPDLEVAFRAIPVQPSGRAISPHQGHLPRVESFNPANDKWPS